MQVGQSSLACLTYPQIPSLICLAAIWLHCKRNSHNCFAKLLISLAALFAKKAGNAAPGPVNAASGPFGRVVSHKVIHSKRGNNEKVFEIRNLSAFHGDDLSFAR